MIGVQAALGKQLTERVKLLEYLRIVFSLFPPGGFRMGLSPKGTCFGISHVAGNIRFAGGRRNAFAQRSIGDTEMDASPYKKMRCAAHAVSGNLRPVDNPHSH